MKRKSISGIILFAVVFSLFQINFQAAGENFPSAQKLKIILKFDDFQAEKNSCKCISTLDYLVGKKIKASFGAVGKQFDNTALGVLKPYLNATNSNGDKLFEVWNHGLDHKQPEFKGTSYEYQKDHFETSDRLIKRFLGIQARTFGAPFNETDSVTTKVVLENSNYKIFIFPRVHPSTQSGVFEMKNRVDIENGTGNPEYLFFVNNFNKYKERYKDYMTLQGHPNMWTPEKLEQFKKIVDFIQEQGCEFVLLYEYYLSVTKK